jgi:hypothetical protein
MRKASMEPIGGHVCDFGDAIKGNFEHVGEIPAGSSPLKHFKAPEIASPTVVLSRVWNYCVPHSVTNKLYQEEITMLIILFWNVVNITHLVNFKLFIKQVLAFL